jgi:eukaryotic-like serine/threonine-protein kinase
VNDTSKYWRDEAVSFGAAYGGERAIVHVLLPREGAPPYQAVVFFPGDGGLARPWGDAVQLDAVSFLLRSGRAVLFPIYKGMPDRPAPALQGLPPLAYRERVIQWHQDLARTIDYAETRGDLDMSRLAYYGWSRGAVHGVIFTALESRFTASVLHAGGLVRHSVPELDGLHYATRVRVPTLVLHGEYDAVRPLDSSGRPLFELLGSPPGDKRLAVLPATGHLLPKNFVVTETLAWLDRHLGPVGVR